MAAKLSQERTLIHSVIANDKNLPPGQPWPVAYWCSNDSLIDSRRNDRETAKSWYPPDRNIDFALPTGRLDSAAQARKANGVRLGRFQFSTPREVPANNSYSSVAETPRSAGWVDVSLVVDNKHQVRTGFHQLNHNLNSEP